MRPAQCPRADWALRPGIASGGFGRRRSARPEAIARTPLLMSIYFLPIGGGTENPYQTTRFGWVACTRSSRGKGPSGYTSGTAGRPRRRRGSSAAPRARVRPITPPTVHSIVTRHLRAAGVDIAGRRHGAHALRHSLAAGMLGGGTPLPTIASVLGHAGTEATAAYLGVDAASLAGCALPAPEVSSPHYRGCAL